MNANLYPLRFEPDFQYRPWGGRRLAGLLNAHLPGHDPIGESWLLSDRDDHSSRVVNGRHSGETLSWLLARWPQEVLGRWAGACRRFPLLLKFLDVRGALSVQVHPSDVQARELAGADSGKTEGWIVIAAGGKARIYAGLTADTTARTLREAITSGAVPDCLAFFTPKPGDAVLIPAGTVHSLSDVVVFEIQQNSDRTLRLFDWNQIDEKTQQARPLQVYEALACIDFTPQVIDPVMPLEMGLEPVSRERLFENAYFTVWRVRSSSPFWVGATGVPRILVCLHGDGQVGFDHDQYPLGLGEVMLLPASIGACLCQPRESICLLEIALPEGDLA